MGLIVYAVLATLPDAAACDEYVAWLRGGHVAAVVRAGALSAQITRFDDAPRVETRYLFADRQALARYESGAAVALRAEGWAKFGSRPGVAFERRIGEELESIPPRGSGVG